MEKHWIIFILLSNNSFLFVFFPIDDCRTNNRFMYEEWQSNCSIIQHILSSSWVFCSLYYDQYSHVCIDMHFCLHQKIYSHSQFCPQLFICSPNERCHFQSLVVRDSNIFMYLLVTRFASVVHIWTSIFCNVLYLRLMIGFTIRADEWMNNVEKTENNTKKEWTHG